MKSLSFRASRDLSIDHPDAGLDRSLVRGVCALVRPSLLALCIAGWSVAATAAEAQVPAPGEVPRSDLPRQQASRPSALERAEPSEYRLNFGDLLEISVRGFAELRQKAMVELDGEVSLPLTGRVRVVGMPLAGAQEVIKGLAAQRPLLQRFPDGREGYVALAPDDVLVTIAEYRPIYILGDVGKPGELPYRPGMTARQAIALGGGFDIMRYRLVNPFTESADLKGQHEVLWTDAARARVKLKRIEVELEGKTELDPDILSDVPLDRAYLEEIVKTEAETLRRNLADYGKEIEHIRGLIELNVAKVDTLKKQLTTEIQGSEVDQQELEQMKDAQRRGNLPLMRLMEIRRIQLTNSTRVLQTRVQFDQAERDLAEARRSLERLHNTWRTKLLTDRQDQSAIYNGLLAKISANSEKLVHTSVLKSRLVRGRGGKVNISIHRSLLDVKKTIVGAEDTPLFPGDTVEIALESERDVDEAVRRSSAAATPSPGKVGEPMPSRVAAPGSSPMPSSRQSLVPPVRQ